MALGNQRFAAAARTLTPPVLALALALSLAAIVAPAARAAIAHLPNGKTVSFYPVRGASPFVFDATFKNLDYNGGPVMPSNRNYPVYWAPPGSPAYPAGYQSGVNRYLEDLAHDSELHSAENVDSVATQYGDSNGHFANYNSKFGEALIDEDPYPRSGCPRAEVCLTDAQIQEELVKFVKAHGLPTNLETEYFLLTPPGVEDCFDAEGFHCSAGVGEQFIEYCAYHSNVPLPGGKQLVYANDPYVGENVFCDEPSNHPNGISDSALIGGLSHEHNESITDPEPNNAWTDFGGNTGENGDKCRTFLESSEFGTPLGEDEIEPGKFAKYNQVVNGHHYWYQQEWSNQGHTCLQRFTLKGALPSAGLTAAEPTTATKVRLEPTGSTTGAGVLYNWQFNDSEPFNTPAKPFETSSSAAFEHTFPRPCRYTVALTVFNSEGTSRGTAKTITVGSLVKPAPEVFLTTARPAAGLPITFVGGPESDPDGIVTEQEWNFGDGSPPVSEFEPAHTYAAPGAYEVTLTETDICGETGSVSQVFDVRAVAGEGGGPVGAGAVLPPPSPPAPTGIVTLPGSVSSRKDGRSKLTLICRGTAPLCSGELILTAKQVVRVHGHNKSRIVTIATVRFTVATGFQTTLSFRLRPLGRKLLKKAHGRLKATLALKQTAPATRTGSVGVRIKLKK